MSYEDYSPRSCSARRCGGQARRRYPRSVAERTKSGRLPPMFVRVVSIAGVATALGVMARCSMLREPIPYGSPDGLEAALVVNEVEGAGAPSVRWAVPFDGPEALACSERTVFVVDLSYSVTALSADSGRVVWQSSIRNGGSESSGGVQAWTTADSLFVFAPHEYAVELSLPTGEQRRLAGGSRAMPGWMRSTAPADDASSDESVRFNRDSFEWEGHDTAGRLLWSTQVEQFIDAPVTLCRSGGALVFGDSAGYVVALDP